MNSAEVVIVNDRATCPYCGLVMPINFDAEIIVGGEPWVRNVVNNTAIDPCDHFDCVCADTSYYEKTGETRWVACFDEPLDTEE